MKYEITVSKSWFPEEMSLPDGSESSTFHTTTTIESAQEAALENTRRVSVRHNIRGKLERLYRWGYKSIRVPKRNIVYEVPCPAREGLAKPDWWHLGMNYGVRSMNESTPEESQFEMSREGERMKSLDMPNVPRKSSERKNFESQHAIHERATSAVGGPHFRNSTARFRMRRKLETSMICTAESATDDTKSNDDIWKKCGVNTFLNGQHLRYEYQVAIGAMLDLRGGSAAAAATSSPTSESSLDLVEYHEELSAISHVDTDDPNIEILGPLSPALPVDLFTHPQTAAHRDSSREIPSANAVRTISQTARRFTAPTREALRPSQIGALLRSNSTTRVSPLHAFAQPARQILARSTSSPGAQALSSVIVARRPGWTPLRPYPLDHGPFARQIDEITQRSFDNSMVREVLERPITNLATAAATSGLPLYHMLFRISLGNPEITYGELVTEIGRIVDGRFLWTGDRISLQPWQYIPSRDILYPTGQTLSRFLEACIELERDSEYGSVKDEPGYRLQKPPVYELISRELNAAGSTNDVRSESNRENLQSYGYSGFFRKDGASYWVTNGKVFAPPTYVDRRHVEWNWRVGLYDFFRGLRLRDRACDLPPPYAYDADLDPNCVNCSSAKRSSIDTERTSLRVDMVDINADETS
jgi:hypothetical protein